MINYLKKIYYEKYSKKSYSLSNVDLVIERIFKEKKKLTSSRHSLLNWLKYAVTTPCNRQITTVSCLKVAWLASQVKLGRPAAVTVRSWPFKFEILSVGVLA